MQPFPYPLRPSIVGSRASLKRRPVLGSLVVATALASYVPARRGTAVDPAAALRPE